MPLKNSELEPKRTEFERAIGIPNWLFTLLVVAGCQFFIIGHPPFIARERIGNIDPNYFSDIITSLFYLIPAAHTAKEIKMRTRRNRNKQGASE